MAVPTIPPKIILESPTSQTSPTSSTNVTEPQIRREPTGELMEDGVNQEQEPTQVAANSYTQESVHKSEDIQSMDYEFIENLFKNYLQEEANARVSPKEVTIFSRLPVTSSQLAVAQQEQGVSQPHLGDLHDVSYIIMSPTTPFKEDIVIDSESEKYEAIASQLLLAHEEEVHLNLSKLSVLHAAIKIEKASFDDDATLCEDQLQQEEVWECKSFLPGK